MLDIYECDAWSKTQAAPSARGHNSNAYRLHHRTELSAQSRQFGKSLLQDSRKAEETESVTCWSGIEDDYGILHRLDMPEEGHSSMRKLSRMQTRKSLLHDLCKTHCFINTRN